MSEAIPNVDPWTSLSTLLSYSDLEEVLLFDSTASMPGNDEPVSHFNEVRYQGGRSLVQCWIDKVQDLSFLRGLSGSSNAEEDRSGWSTGNLRTLPSEKMEFWGQRLVVNITTQYEESSDAAAPVIK